MNLVQKLQPEVFVSETSGRVLQAMSDAVVHQNIIAVVNLPSSEFAPPPTAQLIAGLVRVQVPGNAGTNIRIDDAAGAVYVFTTQQTVGVLKSKFYSSN